MNKMILIIIAAVVLIGGAYMVFSMKSDTKNSMENKAMTTQDDSMNKDGVMVGGALMTPDKDIVDNALGSNDHTTLVAAVKAAGLVETLKGTGPFTVFAPTNEAFAKLPAGTVDTLVMPANKAKLTSILTYHVVPGVYRSSDITEGMTLKTVNGQMLTFTMKDGKWWINDSAMIDIADVISSNGVTHVIDTVLMPQ
ncbi:MAG: fasciclin domain-containing protein [Candidatus Levybacteria bacterium]|nr:fasciclin domain-containing protein [Candidatus Levybacteria bacterium]